MVVFENIKIVNLGVDVLSDYRQKIAERSVLAILRE